MHHFYRVNLYRFTSFIVFLTIAQASFGQTATLTGNVTSNTGEPIWDASVEIEEISAWVTADESGDYILDSIPTGTHIINISLLGYLSTSDTITFEEGQTIKKDFSLQEDVLKIEGVVVSGTRYAQGKSNNPVIVNVINNKLLNATQSIAISEGLNYQSGVRVETNCQNCGFTQVRLNGLEGAYSQILINSRPVFSALNSVYGLDQIPSNIVDRIEVVRSGGSALYGSNAIGGTINIITKEPIENSWEIRSNTSLVDGDALDQTFNLNGAIVDESLKSGVTFYGLNRQRESYDNNGDGFTELVELKNTVIGAKAYLKPTDRSKISADFSAIEEYRRGGDRLDLAPHFTDITEELDHNTFFGGLSYEHWLKNDKDKFSAYVSGQTTDRDSYYGGLGGGRTAEDSLLAINAYGLTEDIALVAGIQHIHYFKNDDVLTAGIENQFYDTEDEIQGYNRLIDQQVNTTGLFAQYEWKPIKKFTALLGARYDVAIVDGNYQIGDINNTADINIGVVSPRATILYNINKELKFRGGYARGFRAPQAFNEDLHISSVGGEPLFVILSDDLDKETSNAFTGSLNYSKSFGLSQVNVLLEGFYTQLQNPFTQVSTGSVLSNGSIVEEVRNGEGANVGGVNFEVGYSPSTKFSFKVGGTAQQTNYTETQVLFEPEVTNSEEGIVAVDEFVRTPNVYGFFTSFYNFSKAFKIDFTGTYTGPLVVPRVVSDSGFLDLVDSESFIDVNLKASYNFKVNKSFRMELSGGVKNIFDSYQDDFDSGPERDSDFIFGPAAPRSAFISVKIGNFK